MPSHVLENAESTQRPGKRLPSLPVALSALTASVLALSALMYSIAPAFYTGDLRAYVEGGRLLKEPGLYTSLFPIGDGGTLIPFIYPPFAAIIFAPLQLVPLPVVAIGWSVATGLALWTSIWLALKLVTNHRLTTSSQVTISLLWTAAALWTAPVRHTLYEGQVSVFIMAGVLVAVYIRSNTTSGIIVGLLAGLKLTPAVTGIYFLLRRRVGTAVTAAVTFAATIAIATTISPQNTFDYFLGGGIASVPERVGGVGTVANQSLRGTLSRFMGHDAGQGTWWILAATALVALAIVAIYRHRYDDFVPLIIIQLTTCALSPLAWSHHWVWIIPLLIWIMHGPMRHTRVGKILAALWILGTVAWYVELMLFVQTSNYQYDRPLWQSIGGSAYVLGLMLVLVWMCIASPPVNTSARAPLRTRSPQAGLTSSNT
ncbi:glycosyltransferase 87 family protein [Rhodococcus erythropolis]|uniref:glycosyltransferase 87 family protein n=1 Tax=Rhodococcus erythropolis TaxID=1833 RepID=UPI0008D14A92|nr:glycosyltransferase 87 family protein [Rhodococcus erythropolis]OFV73548.1 polyprenol-phosphate-mannose-dependent alpha-(1-2)-phosphatidylinositol pentamannoside mannosyltransferase [Rhodococcus erythropolis]